MARQGKVLPARKPRDRSRDEDSVLLRSAETLGRVIGSLQRQLDGATRRLSGTVDDVMEVPPARKGNGSTGNGPRKSKRTAKTTGVRKTTRAKKTARRS